MITDNQYNAIMWWRDLDHDSRYVRALDYYNKRPNDLTDQEIIDMYNAECKNATIAFLVLIGVIILIPLICWLILLTKP
jgi:hypothetical protein